MSFGLIDQVIWNVPKEHVAVVTRGNQSVLFVVDLLLVFLENRQFFQKHGIRPSSLGHFAAANLGEIGCFRFRATHLVDGFALVHCTFDLVVHVLNHLLLLFFCHILVFVFLKVCVSFNANIVVQVVCHLLEGVGVVHLVVHLLLQELEVVLLEVLVKSDAVDEVLVAHTSHNWHDVDGVAIVFHLKVICNEAVIFKADGQHTFVW